MHILYFHQYFVPPDGSGGTRSYEMARRFVQAGHRVVLITSNASFPDNYSLQNARNILEIDGIELRVLNVPYSNKMSFVRRILAFSQFVVMASVESLRTRDVDVVFATSTPLTIAIPCVIAKLRHRCRMVFEVRDLWPEVPIALGVLKNRLLIRLCRFLERFAYRHSDCIVALSPGMAAGIKATGYDEQRLVVIPNSSDVDLFRADTVSAQAFQEEYPEIPLGIWVVYAGTFGQVNGIDYLVEIAAEMRTRNEHIQFVAVGDGRFAEDIRQLARSLNVLDNNFWMVPPIPKNRLPDLLSASTLATSFVVDIPALWNNSANKFFDAFAASRPIAINHEGWQAEFLRESGAGLVLPPRDASLAAQIIAEFVGDPVLLERSRCAAARAADERFSRDRLADQLRYVLEEVVQSAQS